MDPMSPVIRRLVLATLGIIVIYAGSGFYVTGVAGIAILVVGTIAVLVGIDRYSSTHEARSNTSRSDLYEAIVHVLQAVAFGALGLLWLFGFNSFRYSRWWSLIVVAGAGYHVYRIWHPRRLKTGDAALDRIDELAQRDPQAAEAAYEELFASRERQEEEELTRLRAAAKSDLKVAKELRDRLRKQLTPPSVIRQYRKQLGNELGLSLLLETVEERDAATRLEIAELETRIKLLSGRKLPS